jgi:hypothetical protein
VWGLTDSEEGKIEGSGKPKRPNPGDQDLDGDTRNDAYGPLESIVTDDLDGLKLDLLLLLQVRVILGRNIYIYIPSSVLSWRYEDTGTFDALSKYEKSTISDVCHGYHTLIRTIPCAPLAPSPALLPLVDAPPPPPAAP